MPKLVRDSIPLFIEASGKKCKFRLLDRPEHKHYLKLKLEEECKELMAELDSSNIKNIKEEMADVLEVIEALCWIWDIDDKEVKRLQTLKGFDKGSFRNGILLEEVYDD